MRHVVIVKPGAERDLEELYWRIAMEQPAAADRFMIKAREVINSLGEWPLQGRLYPMGRRAPRDLRRINVPRFPVAVFYIVDAQTVTVLRVLHASLDLPRRFPNT